MYYEITPEFICKLRTDAELSKDEFGRLFSVSMETVKNWEAGRTAPSTLVEAIMKQLRAKLDSDLEVRKTIKNMLIFGGIVAFLLWLFNKE